MRIRTIKPEFWQSETMASIPKDSRLLAIALLNYADDEGFFFAVPQVIQGALFPFDEDSTSIRRGLDELSRIGFCSLGKTTEGKRIGRIVNFLDHQRIDRPQASKIAGLEVVWGPFDEHSTNIRRALDAGMEGNGKGMEREGDHSSPKKRELDAEAVYQAYPKKVGKADALKAITKALKTVELDALLEATTAYTEAVSRWPEADKAFVPHPSTWFNQQRWADDRATWARTATSAPQPPTEDEWMDAAKRLDDNRDRQRDAKWSSDAARAEFLRHQASGWRGVVDWRSSLESVYARFLSIETAARNRRVA